MKRDSKIVGLLIVSMALVSTGAVAQLASEEPVPTKVESPEALSKKLDLPTTTAEARGRARMLHETIHGALQVMHRDFFREDEGLTIPSRSLDDVFAALKERTGVTVRWISVDTDAMNVDHTPRGAFEENAVKALISGKAEFESVENGSYRYVSHIRLASQCLKCHVPNRTSTDDRRAGVAITIPLRQN